MIYGTSCYDHNLGHYDPTMICYDSEYDHTMKNYAMKNHVSYYELCPMIVVRGPLCVEKDLANFTCYSDLANFLLRSCATQIFDLEVIKKSKIKISQIFFLIE